jgi:hypothetical protein
LEVAYMSETAKRILYWAPRVLGLLFAAFISIFAFDVFDGGHGFWETALDLLMHLVPTAIVLVVLAIAWRWEWVGAVVFGALGVFYIATAWGRFPLVAYLAISGPMFVMAGLFLANWLMREELRPG